METLRYRPTPAELRSAAAFESFRSRCKKLLADHGMGFDKFTVVSHDSFIGYITERAVRHHLLQRFPDRVQAVRTWEENFDVRRVLRILDQDSVPATDVEYVKEYFYDRWDLEIVSSRGTIHADVKTALTKKEPSAGWSFLYPVVQAEKPGKDLLVLVYYVQGSDALTDLRRLVLVGATTPDRVTSRPLVRAGERTRFGTESRTDNYETELGEDYTPIGDYL